MKILNDLGRADRRTRLKDWVERLTREEAIELLRELQGPLLEMALSGDSWDFTASDVPLEVMLSLQRNPRLEALFLTDDELELWEQFKGQRGCSASEIGEFVYGAEKNPWT